MTNHQDKLFYGIVAVLAVLTAFYAFGASPEAAGTQKAADAAPETAQETAAPAAPEVPTPAAAKPPAAPATLTYERALELYGKYRIQFVSCHGNPGSISLGKGAKLMLDNRDKKPHTVKVGSIAYRLAASGFAIATMREVGKLNVTCDGGGAATVEVQP